MIAARRHLLPVIWHLLPGIWYIVRGGISMQCGMLICTLIDCTVHTSNYCPELFSGLNYSAREACWVKQGEEKLAMDDAGSNVDDAGSKTRRRLCATIYLPANQPSRAFSNTNTQIKIHKYKYTNTQSICQPAISRFLIHTWKRIPGT